VSIQMKRMDSNAEIRVSSSAGGINRESLSHVFDRFCAEERTGARRFGQLGLGLALVREIVDAHGGTVRVDSHGEERGVTFTVRLPRRSQASPSTRRTSSDSDWPSQGFVR
jgi:signal transduction histidine kinase